MNTNKRFLEAITAKQTSLISRDALESASMVFRKRLIDFGSETDDNKACANHIELATGRTADGLETVGLRLRKSKVFMSDFVSLLENDDVVSSLQAMNRSMQRTEIESALRLITLIFAALEQNKLAGKQRVNPEHRAGSECR